MDEYARHIQKLELGELLADMADVVNRMAPERMRDLFVDDARWHVAGEDHVGVDAIVAFFASLCEEHLRIFQVVSTQRFFLEHDGDADLARGEAYIYEVGKSANGEVFQLAGRCDDVYRRGGDGWRFVERVYVPSIWGTEGRLKVFPLA